MLVAKVLQERVASVVGDELLQAGEGSGLAEAKVLRARSKLIEYLQVLHAVLHRKSSLQKNWITEEKIEER